MNLMRGFHLMLCNLGSRKSSRLQQQLVPLVAPPVVENLNLTTVEAPPYLDATTLPYDCVSLIMWKRLTVKVMKLNYFHQRGSTLI